MLKWITSKFAQFLCALIAFAGVSSVAASAHSQAKRVTTSRGTRQTTFTCGDFYSCGLSPRGDFEVQTNFFDCLRLISKTAKGRVADIKRPHDDYYEDNGHVETCAISPDGKLLFMEVVQVRRFANEIYLFERIEGVKYRLTSLYPRGSFSLAAYRFYTKNPKGEFDAGSYEISFKHSSRFATVTICDEDRKKLGEKQATMLYDTRRHRFSHLRCFKERTLQ